MITEMPYNYEFNKVNYSLVEQVQIKKFLHNFIDKKYRRDCLFFVLYPKSDRIAKEMKFWDSINRNIGVLNEYYEHCEIAVYDRMTKLEMPEKICGNCKHFHRHYSESDDWIGFVMLQEGHCTNTKRIKTRNVDSDPYKKNCFEWNDRCRQIVKEINGEIGK